MPADPEPPTYRVVDFAELPGVPARCGTARRAFADVPEYPGTIHVTDIALDAVTHYHRLDRDLLHPRMRPRSEDGTDGDSLPVRPGVYIMIPPGVRHRAVGRMRVLIVVFPKFDPADEWFD